MQTSARPAAEINVRFVFCGTGAIRFTGTPSGEGLKMGRCALFTTTSRDCPPPSGAIFPGRRRRLARPGALGFRFVCATDFSRRGTVFGARMSLPMKVLHIVKTVVGAGWAYEQTRVLRSLGIDVVVALPSDTDGLAPRYREAGVSVVRADLDFPARRPWLLPARLRACRELVEQVRPDLIHTHHVGTTFVVRAALGKDSG